MKEQMIESIASNLQANKERLRREFTDSVNQVGVRYVALDAVLPEEIARRISAAFPPVESMRLMDSFRERKYTSKSFEKFDPLMVDVTFAFQDPRVLSVIEEITGITDQVADSHLYAGGLSAMGAGHFLGPHIDNSHDGDRKLYRTLNLLYYLTPDWKAENGGSLELWDRKVRKGLAIPALFNRLVIMETNPWSWHSVNSIRVDGLRRCVSNYYFSPKSPTGRDYFNVTSFSARPEQKVARVQAWVDNKLRRTIRFFIPKGIGKKDVYKAKGA